MATPKRTFYRPHKRVQYTGELVNPHTGQVTKPPSMTKQEFVKECDVNNVIKSYSPRAMAAMIAENAAKARYEDLPDNLDFQASIELVRSAEASFMTLPAKIRDRFGQDPVQFLAFLSDPKNLDEARKLGLAKPAPVVPSAPPSPTPPAATPSPTGAPSSPPAPGGGGTEGG